MQHAEEIETLITREQLAERIETLGRQITRDYAGKELVLVAVLKGSFVLCADLARAIDLPLAIEFLGLKSYGDSQTTSGVVQITSDLQHPVAGKHLLIVEDIIDTGLTMSYLRSNLATRNPASVKLCALLHKPSRARIATDIDYLGFTIEDKFVVGYGLDWAEKYRNLSFVGVVRS
ncbi:MAG TPA: hypoxanthine phosphoribosyltransferase [Polyangiales bacterium]|nr:hypoxanthine phosphoribosyltransferase [Polyangiales bacterium]